MALQPQRQCRRLVRVTEDSEDMQEASTEDSDHEYRAHGALPSHGHVQNHVFMSESCTGVRVVYWRPSRVGDADHTNLKPATWIPSHSF
jgi:hypothetical protein